MLKLIACIDKYNSLGIYGDLIYKIKDDLKIFKEKTLNKTVVMGRNTFKSINYTPLPNRENIIISNTISEPKDGSFKVFKNIDDVFNIPKDVEVFITGGKNIYEYFLPYYDELHLSIIKDEFTKNYDINKSVKLNINNIKDFTLKSKEEYEMFYVCVYKRTSI